MAKKNVWKYHDDTERIVMNCDEDKETGCWVWNKRLDKDGYGQMTRHGTKATAHRVAYESFVGPIPEGLCVCHHCDNPPCCNPDHLFTGTVAENNADMKAKGRYVHHRGEKASGSKLTDAEAAEILSLATAGEMTQKEIGNIYGVGHTTVSAILVGDNWKHIERG